MINQSKYSLGLYVWYVSEREDESVGHIRGIDYDNKGEVIYTIQDHGNMIQVHEANIGGPVK